MGGTLTEPRSVLAEQTKTTNQAGKSSQKRKNVKD
jgi:hypothetical protein